jgi:hypothetical protein
MSGIRTQDPSVLAGEDGSCFRPCGHCDRLKQAQTTGRSQLRANKSFLERPSQRKAILTD